MRIDGQLKEVERNMSTTLSLRDVVKTGQDLASAGQTMTIDLVRRAIRVLPMNNTEDIFEEADPIVLDDEDLDARVQSY